MSLKQYLPEAIGKLSGYYSATFELICVQLLKEKKAL